MGYCLFLVRQSWDFNLCVKLEFFFLRVCGLMHGSTVHFGHAQLGLNVPLECACAGLWFSPHQHNLNPFSPCCLAAVSPTTKRSGWPIVPINITTDVNGNCFFHMLELCFMYIALGDCFLAISCHMLWMLFWRFSCLTEGRPSEESTELCRQTGMRLAKGFCPQSEFPFCCWKAPFWFPHTHDSLSHGTKNHFNLNGPFSRVWED